MDEHAPSRAGSATLSHGSDPIVGRLLDGRYLIGPRIARGGMASVYEATDTRLDRVCAVKVMHPGLGDDEAFAERFVREARAAARLSHPNVVAVFDQGEDPSVGGGTVFLAMEYVPGHTLRDVVRKEAPMPATRALALLEPVLSALAAAHRAGIVHRDVKPENVLIASDSYSGTGVVKVADFGLAKAVSTDTQHTATGGVIIGTVSYLAPELVVDGRSDARADVYAAGVVLYELLTGSKPHEGESPIAVAYKHVHEDVPAPSLRVPGLPSYVDALVARATSRDRAQRPADAGVLLHQVHRVSHALSRGVREDEELTADLAPMSITPAEEPSDSLALTPVAAPADLAGADGPPDEPLDRLVDRPPATRRTPVVPASAAPPSTTTPPPDHVVHQPLRSRRSRRGPILLALALLAALAAGGGAYWFGVGRYTTTPGVLGMAQQAAGHKLDSSGLTARVGDPAYSETVPKGDVIGTDPRPGAKVLHDGTVTMTLSLGKERYRVPKTAGLTEDQAQDLLAVHLGFGQAVPRWSETVAAGQVIRSTPPAGQRERPDTAVDLVISKGPRPIHVRDWSGKAADRAERVLRHQRLQVDATDEEYSDSVPKGQVISQTPPAGVAHRGDTITLVVSKGPELVKIPGDLVAQGVSAATSELEALGFHVEVEQSDYYIGVGFVYSSSPGSNDYAPRGSTVVLHII